MVMGQVEATNKIVEYLTRVVPGIPSSEDLASFKVKCNNLHATASAVAPSFKRALDEYQTLYHKFFGSPHSITSLNLRRHARYFGQVNRCSGEYNKKWAINQIVSWIANSAVFQANKNKDNDIDAVEFREAISTALSLWQYHRGILESEDPITEYHQKEFALITSSHND